MESWWRKVAVAAPMLGVAMASGILLTVVSLEAEREVAAANVAPVPTDWFPENKPIDLPAEEPPETCPDQLPEDIAADSRASGTVIVIWKSKYKIGVYDGGQLAQVPARELPACFDIALGFEPEGAKLTQGDGKTPEGWYWVSWKIPQGQTSYYKALYVNYPNGDDAALALAEGRIDQATHDRIASAASKHSTVTDSPLGGLIEIHGSGSRPRNWTLGCVALDNQNMDWLYDAAVPGGTAIRILP